MPELPEVETTRRGIEPHILNQTVGQVKVREPRLRWPVSTDLHQLEGQRIEAVERRGKYLLLRTLGGTCMIHLGMSGHLTVVPEDKGIKKHDHVDIVFTNGQALRYHDPRRFGSVLWVEGDVMSHKLLHKLGPEPLSEGFDADYLHALSRGKKQAIKTWLMNSHTVVGVGNIYANESLFKAAIRPTTPAGRVSLARYVNLVEHIKKTLEQAIVQGGTTLNDFFDADGKTGYFQQQLLVYGRQGEACVNCGLPLKHLQLAQRATVYCPKCQR